MNYKTIQVFCLIVLCSLFMSCKNESTLEDKVIMNEEVTKDIQDIQIKDETIMSLCRSRLSPFLQNYGSISIFDDSVYALDEKTHSFVSFDNEMNVKDLFQYDPSINMISFKAVGKDKFIMSDYARVDNELEIKIHLINETEDKLLYNSKQSTGETFKFIRDFVCIEEKLLVLDFDFNLFEIENNVVTRLELNDSVLDITQYKEGYCILTDVNLLVYNKAGNLISNITLNEPTALQLSLDIENKLYILCVGKLLVSEDLNNFKKYKMGNQHFNYTVEDFWVIDSERLVVKEEEELSEYKLADLEVINANKTSVSIGLSTKDTAFTSILKNLESDKYKFNIVYYDDLTTDEYATKISAELMSNSAPDLIITQGRDRIYDFILNDSFYDLNNLIESDDLFDITLYEDKVVDSCKTEDQLFVFPMSFIPDYVCINEKLMLELGLTLDNLRSWSDIYNVYTEINQDLDNPEYHIGYHIGSYNDEFLKYMYSPLYAQDMNTFIDYENQTASFDSDEFIEVVSKMKVIYKANMNSSMSLDDIFGEFDNHSDNTTLKNHLLYTFNIQNGYQYSETYDEGEILSPVVTGYLSDIRTNENFFGSFISINSNAVNIEAAWDVLKMIISYDSEWAYSKPGRFGGVMGFQDFGISKRANKEKVENYIEYLNSSDFQKYVDRTKSDTNGGRNFINVTLSPEEKVAIMHRFVEYDYKMIFKSSFDDIIISELKRYFEDEISASTLGTILQSKTEIYLGE